jgi:fatty acid desaturase
VAKHDSAASAWVIIRGVVYDVTAWADRHPGGRELILLHAGRECSDTFDSYHPFSQRADKILAKYAIGAQALPLLHVMHDSSHAACSSSPTLWSLIGRGAMDWFAGASMTSWLNQHVVGHHIYTNVAGADPDLPVDFKSDVRRIVYRQVLLPIYKFQHLYLPPLYGVLGLKFRVQDIFETFITLTNGPLRVNPLSVGDWAEMILSKAFWGVFFLAEFSTGWYLAFNFQVSHVSTACEYPGGDEEVTSIDDEWAISQVKSSVDYGHGSFVTTFLTGALNYQVTHHLFPGVSQYHYPAIAPLILDVCKKYKIKYNVLPDFTAAMAGHFDHLVIMGKMGKRVTIHMG